MCGCTPTHTHRGQRGLWEILLYHTLGHGLSQIWSLTSFKKGPSDALTSAPSPLQNRSYRLCPGYVHGLHRFEISFTLP